MNKLFKNTTIYAIGYILPNVATFLLLPLYTAYLTPADYGIVSSMTVLQGALIIFMTFAIERSIYRLYFDYNEGEKKEYLGTITISIFLVSILATATFLFVLDDALNLAFISIPFNPYYVYIILSCFFTTFSLVPKIYFQVEQKPVIFAALSILQTVIDLIVRIILIVVLQRGAEGQLFAMLIVSLAFVPVYIFIAIKDFKLVFKKEMMINSFKFSIPMIPVLFCSWIINLSDRFFIERYFSLADLGIYSLGYKMGQIVSIIGAAFLTAYNPVFYGTANDVNEKNPKMKLAKYNTIFMVVISVLTFLIAFYSKEIIILIANERYYEAYLVIPLIAYSYMMSCFGGLNNLSLYQEKKPGIVMKITIGTSVINIILNYFLIVRYGAMGAAAATLITFLLVFLSGYVYAKRIYDIKSNWRMIVMMNGAAVVLLIINFILSDANIVIYTGYKLLVTALVLYYIIKNRNSILVIIRKTEVSEES